MIMALGTTESGAHPDRHRGVDSIDDRLMAKLLIVGATLGVRHRVAMESGGNFLVASRMWQQVPGKLLDAKFIERQIPIHRVDHPVAVRPHAPAIILLVALC